MILFSKLTHLAIFTALTLAATLLMASPARACRDCPFPLKIGKNQWLTVDRKMVITITEKRERYALMTKVRLTDAKTGTLIAWGSVLSEFGQNTVSLSMSDRNGGSVLGRILWLDRAHSRIQAQFSCAFEHNDCLLSI